MLRCSACRVMQIIVCLCWATISISPLQAEEGDVLRAEDIVRQLTKPGRTRKIGFEPDGGNSLPPSSQRIALPAIQFEFDSDRLTHSALIQMRELAKALESDSLRPFYFAVQGHTDSVGDRTYNRALSLRRARAVKHYLVAGNISSHRLVEVGLGEDFPIVDTSGEDGRNRRVEVVNLGSIPQDPESVPATPARKGERRALLIGIDEYQHVSSLIGPVNDAKAMKSFITDHIGFDDSDIKMLLDSEATRDNILALIEDWLIDGTEDGDEVFLFFSGHGFQQPDVNGDEADRLDETLVPVDVAVTKDGTATGMITDDEMAALMSHLSGRRVDVIVDACHSGTSTRFAPVFDDDWRYVKSPRRADGRPLQIVVPGRKRGVAGSLPESFLSTKDLGLDRTDLTVWTAVKAEQKALVDEESADEFVSVFTRRILWGVRDGKADRDRDGVVARSELYDFLVKESDAYCKRHPRRCPSGLTPQLHATSGRMERAAFANAPVAHLPPRVSAAKDILVRQAEHLAADAGNGVRLSIEPGSRLTVGTVVDISVESDHDGYLVVLDIDATGKMVQIFPNEFSLRSGVSDRIYTGRPVHLPGAQAGFRFRAEPPAGHGVLMAIVSEESVQLRDLVSRHKDLSVVPRPDAYLVEMGEALRASGDMHRSAATLAYEVVTSSP